MLRLTGDESDMSQRQWDQKGVECESRETEGGAKNRETQEKPHALRMLLTFTRVRGMAAVEGNCPGRDCPDASLLPPLLTARRSFKIERSGVAYYRYNFQSLALHRVPRFCFLKPARHHLHRLGRKGRQARQLSTLQSVPVSTSSHTRPPLMAA